MKYVLSTVHPPEAPAAYGKAVVLDPVGTKEALQSRIEYVLTTEAGADKSEAMSFGLTVITADPGWEFTHSSGMVFRFDPADNAPHPCPCGVDDGGTNVCGRLVLPSDHAYAHDESSYCTGCFTWNSGPQCLPANTAHTEEP